MTYMSYHCLKQGYTSISLNELALLPLLKYLTPSWGFLAVNLSWAVESLNGSQSNTHLFIDLQSIWRYFWRRFLKTWQSPCWQPLFHILTVNFLGINWALHYVPFIFYLYLISSTSFGWVLISGEHMPKLGKTRQTRPAGLAPLQTFPRLWSRGNVMQLNVSEPRIGCQFDRMDWKACTRIKGPTI
jgi:hypothetical protein